MSPATPLGSAACCRVKPQEDSRGWHGGCSTKYVRGREARRPELTALAFLSFCNGSFILLEEVLSGKGI